VVKVPHGEFLQRARAEGLPAKVDEYGILRVFDPKTRSFAAHNRNGTPKTFFKPDSRITSSASPAAR
jgi:pyocin large subunit-like protein